MVNALHKYQGSVVENDNVLWNGRDNAGLTGMTHVNYSKDLTLFKLHFSNLNKKFSVGSCLCMKPINQEMSFIQFMCCGCNSSSALFSENSCQKETSMLEL